MIRAAGWRPNSFRGSFGSQMSALLRRFVWPDVHEARDRTGDRGHRRQEWRDPVAAGNGLAPEFDGRCETVVLEDIPTDFETGAVWARPHRRQKIEGDKY